MKNAARVAILVAVFAVGGGLVWMFIGRTAREVVTSNAQVLGALAAVAAVLIALIALWPRRTAAQPVTAGQVDAALEYLANEALQYWQMQAKNRQITIPSPASVRWAWASEDVAIPAAELQPDLQVVSGGLVLGEPTGRLLTAGVVTQLREQLYERLDRTQGRIVVLGGPGAGKTAAMLLLLIDILNHWRPGSDQPVPMWLTLGGWNPKTSSLRDWAATTLARDYPGLSAPAHGGPHTTTELIRAGRIALFLDGLDEMAPTIQGQALRTIDREAAGLRVVLTSRPTEYRAALAAGRLYGAAVVNVLPVNVEDATAFLLAEQLGERRHTWRHVTDCLRNHPDSVAARTLTTPMALSLARETYGHADPTDLFDTNAYPDPDALLQHLLACSLVQAYPDPAERQHATQWLSWIAQHMDTHRDLRWWDILTWTSRWQLRLATTLTVALTGGLLYGLMGALIGVPTAGLAAGLTDGLMSGLIGGIAFGVMSGVVGRLIVVPRAATLRWPTRKELCAALVLGVEFGLVFVLIFGLGFMPELGLESRLELGFTFGLAFGLGLVLKSIWFVPLPTAHATDPLEAYQVDRRCSLTMGLAVGIACGIACGFIIGLDYGFIIGLLAGLGAGLGAMVFVGPTLGLVAGLGPALLLTIGQMIWWVRGQRVQFLPLLQAALHRQVLRQAGAVYQFRHAALQDFLKTHDASSVE
jgi:hypothetical protein